MSAFECDRLRALPYAEYLETYHWQTLRRLALEAAEQACILCDGGDDLDVHHRTYERRGAERLSDLVVLCRSCHEKVHDRMGVQDKPVDPNNVPDLLALGRRLGRGRRTR